MIWSLLLHPICIYSSSKKSWWELLIHDWDVWADSIHFQVFFQLHKKVQGMCVYTCLLALKNWTFCGEKKQDWRRRFFRIVWKGRLDVILFLSAIHCLNHVRHSSIFKVFYKKKTYFIFNAWRSLWVVITLLHYKTEIFLLQNNRKYFRAKYF